MTIAQMMQDPDEINRLVEAMKHAEEVPDEELRVGEQVNPETLDSLTRPLAIGDHIVVKEHSSTAHFDGMVGIIRMIDQVEHPVSKKKYNRIGVEILGCQMGHDLRGALPSGSVRGWDFFEDDLIRID